MAPTARIGYLRLVDKGVPMSLPNEPTLVRVKVPPWYRRVLIISACAFGEVVDLLCEPPG